MFKKKLTPEDKLLEIIESPSARKKTTFSRGKPKGFYALKTLLSSPRAWKKILKLVTVGNINKILIGSCTLLTIFAIFDFSHQRILVKRHLFKIETTKEDMREWASSRFSLTVEREDSIRKAAERNIFSFLLPEPKTLQEDMTSAEAYLMSVQEKIKLVGIIWSEISPQAIIEDAQTSKTFLLNTGDRVDLFIIKKIQRDAVVLEKDGEEIILR